MKSPFKFLDAFELRDRAEFFGRDEEIDQLYRMVNKNRLVLVYGQSGTGKTSLVQCGLASRYDATDWLPVFVRRGAGMMASFAEALGKVLNRTLTSVTPADIDAAYAIYLRPLYLIFDQFEELFILGSLEEQQQFVEMIATLHQAELPCRILFIIREEYLGALYNFEKTMPTLFDRRLRVEPMSAVKVAAVLSQSFERFHISLEAPAQNLSQIIEKVSEKRAGVQLPYLQVYLDLFWQEDFGRTYPQGAPAGDGYPALEFDTREIEAFGEIGDVLGRFLARQRRELQDRLATLLPGAAGTEINRLLDVFVTEEGTKRPVTLERRGDEVTLGNVPAAALDDIPNPLLFAGLDLLERSRLLRVAGNQAELAHDALAALIDRERSAEQRQRNEVNQRLRHAWREYQLTGGQDYHPSEKLVLDTGALLEQLRLPPELLQFYEMSRRAVEDRKHDAERRAREAEAQAAEAERRRRRATLLAWGAGVAALLAILASGWAYTQTQKAGAAAQVILDKEKLVVSKTDEANAAVERATEKEREAQTNFEKAQGATGMADEQQRLAGEALHRAQQERQNAETAAVSIVHSVLANATEQIRLLDYAGAEATLRDASKLVQDKPQDNPLGKLKSEVANTLLEAAFFFAESGQYAQAGPALSTAARLLGQAPPMLPEEIERWRTTLQTLSPQPYQKLRERYFGDFVTIQGGAYQMDSSYTVTLSSFELASTETTVWQYNLFCAAQGRSVADRTAADHSSVEKTSDPGWGWQGDHPVVYVNWYDAVEYANWLSGKLGLAPAYSIDALTKDTSNQSSYDTYKWTVKPKPGANGYRLPTEAEWEYAATNRGADQFIYAGDSILNTVGWYGENSSNRTHAVKTKTANGLRLFDLSGNVWEWCWDWYADEYPSEAQKNPTGPPEGSLRVLRGGSWRYDAVSARVRYRYDGYPLYRFDLCGFRLARAVNF